MDRRSRLNWGLLLLVGLLLAGQPLRSQGQIRIVNGAEEGKTSDVQNVFQPAPSDVRRPLVMAERAIDEGRYSDAAYQLGQLLLSDSSEDPEAQDYFLVDPDQAGEVGHECLKAAANRMIAALPPQGRQAYELHYGAQARAMRDQALSAGDLDQLSEVTRRFFHTEAGYEAALLAGRLELMRGRPTAASLYLKRLADVPRLSAEFEPELSMLLATCWLYSNMPERAEATLIDLKKNRPDARFRVGSREVGLFAKDDQALEWFTDLVGGPVKMVSPLVADWIVYRGNPQRNGKSQGSLPIMNYRWLVPTTLDHTDETTIDRLAKQYRADGVAIMPALQPLAVGDTVLMRTPNKLMGVDFRSGKRVWVWPPWEDEPMEPLGGQTGPQLTPLTRDREQDLHQRVWEDAAHGQLSSDGERLFLLHELDFAAGSPPSAQQMMILRAMGRLSNGRENSCNQLVCLSLARQGAAQWIVGGITGEDEPRLADAFFLGVPLPIAGRLYCMAEFNGEIRLVVLDVESGRLLWQQQLAHVEGLVVSTDISRRLAGATPSYEGGVLLCPTGAGAVVAVDVATRSLLWGYQYLKTPKNTTHPSLAFQMQMQRRQTHPLGQRWSDASVTVAEGRVLLTAFETDQLYCLDLLTGEPLWEPQPRGDRLYLACVHEGKAVFVGVEEVTALRLSDGQAAWEKPLTLSSPPGGRGFPSAESYFLPTSDSELLQIDLDAGKLVKRTETTIPLGNLVCFRDQIISQGPDFLATFHQAEALRRHVHEQLAAKPRDAEALTQYGELMLQDGKRSEAIASFRKALMVDGQHDTARDLLVTTLLADLRDDFSPDSAALEDISRLIDRPGQRSEYLRLVAWGWQQKGEPRKAFDAYLELARLQTELLDAGAAAQLQTERVERNLNVRIDRWIATRIGELLKDAPSDDRDYMEQQIGAAFDQAIGSGEISPLRRFLQLYGHHPLADQVHLVLADRLLQTGELIEAELLLIPLEQSPDETVRARATAALARLLLLGRQQDAAVAFYRRLETEFPGIICRDGRTGSQLCAAAREEPELKEAWQEQLSWRHGDVKVSESPQTINRYPSYRRVYPCNVVQRQGPTDPGLQVSYDQHRNSLNIQEGRGNTLVVIGLGSQKLNTSDFGLTHARVYGHLLLVAMGNELLAIDLLQASRNPSEAILWRTEMVHGQPGVSSRSTRIDILKLTHPWGGERRIFANSNQQRIGVTSTLRSSGICYMHARELVCADPLTGDVNWSRDGLPQGSDVFGDGERIFVVPPRSEEALVFSESDGRDLGRRKVDPTERRWATLGQNVLAWEQTGADQPLELRLYDAWTQQEIWREAFPVRSRGTLVGHDQVAIVQADGRLLIRNLRDDHIDLEARIEPEDSLETVHVLRSSSQYLIMTNRNEQTTTSSSASQIRTIVSGSSVPLVTGRLYAFDRASGEACWEQPAAIDRFGFPVDQPPDTPVVVFIRQVVPKTSTGSRRQHTAVMALDRRDGRELMNREDIPAQTYTFDVIADPQSQEVAIGLPVKTLVLSFTDDPIPPKPEPGDETPSAQDGKDRQEDRDQATDEAAKAAGLRAGIDPFGGNAVPPAAEDETKKLQQEEEQAAANAAP